MSLGESLRLRRKILKLSLRDLAEKIGVSHMTINRYEKDEQIPDSATLIQLSKTLQIPLPVLVRPENQHIHLSRIAFRTKQMTLREKNQINAETKEWLERYLQIESFTETAQDFLMPESFPRTISSFEEAERAAEDLRDVWDLGSDPIENLTALLEDNGIKVGIIDGITKFDALFTDYDGQKIIVVKKNLPRERQRFTLAHELGHCLLKIDGDLDEEKAMHRFAGSFLVPDSCVEFELRGPRNNLSPRELFILKQKYGLSMAAWVYRAKDVGLISAEYFEEIRIYFAKTGWVRKEPGDDPSHGERPTRMEKMVLQAHAEGIISTSKAAELLNQSISTFCSVDGESDIECAAVLCA